MPRLLPRLLEKLKKNPIITIDHTKLKRKLPKVSKFRPLPPKVSLDAADYPRSIILSPGNPITDWRLHTPHKRLPPKPFLLKKDYAAQKRKRFDKHDLPRKMTEEELNWFASPYRAFLVRQPA
jgi:hypothetical protein